MKIGDHIKTSGWIEAGFANPKVPPGREGKIVGKDNIRDWRVHLDSVSVDITVLEDEIELTKTAVQKAA